MHILLMGGGGGVNKSGVWVDCCKVFADFRILLQTSLCLKIFLKEEK